MKLFPDTLKVENKDNFQKMNYQRIKCYLRRDLYDHIISHEEKDYFDLGDFNKRRLNNTELLDQMVQELIVELESIGWTAKTSFGGTGLFIYSDDPPPNYYPDGLE